MRFDRKQLLLYGVTDRSWLNGQTLYEQVRKALEGGVSFLQLREKNLSEQAFLEEAKEIQKLCREYKVPFIINDNVDLALEIDADGVHVGQDDMEAGEVRKRLGEDKIIGRDVTVREMIEEVEKDRAYYYRSGGGITLSGGECMCQADFSRDLLRAAKERGINTAVESMACAPWEKIEQVLPYLDVYLMDIKHMDQEKHKEFTGRANGLMLENARRVALYGKTRLVIRVPVIPTFNDSVEEIQAIARFAASLPGVNKIHLLPYHRLGQDKYEGLGRPYLMEGILPPTAEHMQMLKNAVHAVCSLDCQIGG